MGIFNTLKEPVFLKEDDFSKQWLEELKSMKDSLNIEGQKIIDRDIKCLEYGIEGEQNIAFELKHSHMPMYIMQDIYIEHKGLTAQIDYI
ncbi:MAG: NERD domain-containing protein, partial [Lachnospiraceae bacterium]|nr:NERD domain-containing protein [Lachnospiraceae bacterium]